jgi:bacteriorhodopsin
MSDLPNVEQLRIDAEHHPVIAGAAVNYLRRHGVSAEEVVDTVKRDHINTVEIENAAARLVHNYHGFLNPQDGVAISFWIISIAMVASTVFFINESMSIASNWKTSINVGSLVTLIAAVHYFYMREYWVQMHESPIVYRYIDWSLTVPLQMVEFFLILNAVNPNVPVGIFWRLMLGTVAMLAFGYMGEIHAISPPLGFCLGMCGWFFILSEIFVGEASKAAQGKEMSEYVKSAFGTCRFIVTAGWSIYPAGYFFGYMLGSVSDVDLNLLYNLADFVNKIAFCAAIWAAGKRETRAKAQGLGAPLMG